MSTKRILAMSALGIIFIAAVIGIMLLFSFSGHDNRVVPLPEPQTAPEINIISTPDALNRVEVTTDTVQDVVASLSRPTAYHRNIIVESFWSGGHAVYNIVASVTENATALRVSPSVGQEKRIIVTQDKLYIWYIGDRTHYAGDISSADHAAREADEWQMLVSYEDLLEIDKNDIVEAGYVDYDGIFCVYANCRTLIPGYTRKYYIPTDSGLLLAAEEYDEKGNLVYNMAAEAGYDDEIDPLAFVLPDGTSVIE